MGRETHLLVRVSEIYPIAQVKNDEASEAEAAAAKDFIDFVCSEDSKAVFRHYNFSTEVK